MTQNSFTRKQLRITLTLVSPNTTFPGTNSNTLILTDFRMSAHIEGVQNLSTNANIRIYGMTQDQMNALSVAWFKPNVVSTNEVTVEANDGSGWVQVFQGIMIDAQPQYRTAPDVYFNILASVQYFSQLAAVPPLSYKGTQSVAVIVQQISDAMGLGKIQNNGVTTVLTNPYFPGSLFDQLTAVCKQGGVDFTVEGGTIAIFPASQGRLNVPPVILNEKSGLQGYPALERAGLRTDCLFNPALTLASRIQVESDVPNANGIWTIIALRHALESVTPNGAWQSSLLSTKGVNVE